MKILAFNGSPRKEWNTATLLNKALEGAASQGATTELINLYELNYKGCMSCFACKLKGGSSYGHCVINDDLKPIFAKIEQADAVIFGSPIYFGDITGQMRSFLERLLFQYYAYKNEDAVLFPKRLSVGMIYTMNVDHKLASEWNYTAQWQRMESFLSAVLGETEVLYAHDTYQFSDYNKYVCERFDETHKAQVRATEFPKQCQQAFDLGVRLVSK